MDPTTAYNILTGYHCQCPIIIHHKRYDGAATASDVYTLSGQSFVNHLSMSIVKIDGALFLPVGL